VSVVNALSERLEVEVARGGQLYRQIYQRGKPKAGLEKLGKIANRRGTKVRFKPDEQIFGKLKFNPQRVFKMARAKAYLFGGVEIRWNCDPELLKGLEGVPAEETFHFPEGLSDYLAVTINGATLVHPDIFAGKSQKEGGHGSVEWAVAFVADRRIPVLVLQHHPHPQTAAPTSPACVARCCAASRTMPSAWDRASAPHR
jgi:Type IIA topoisomerase (DNA gyrase/topo II, topoisomerase IV), B subunit